MFAPHGALGFDNYKRSHGGVNVGPLVDVGHWQHSDSLFVHDLLEVQKPVEVPTDRDQIDQSLFIADQYVRRITPWEWHPPPSVSDPHIDLVASII